METSVRFIPTQTCDLRQNGETKTVKTHDKPALCFRGKKYALGIINDDDRIHPIRLTLKDHDHCKFVPFGSGEYSVPKFITHLERIMMVKPITQEALSLIKQYPNLPEDFEDVKNTFTARSPTSPRARSRKVSNCIPSLATEFKTVPQKIRKFLRQQGLSAPYDDEKAIRKLMANFNK